MSPWKLISTESDIDDLMIQYMDFHDACIVSVDYKSGVFVDDKGTMHFSGPSAHELLMILQSQQEQRPIGLCFTGLRQLHLTGWQYNYGSEISSAYLSFHKGLLPGDPERVIVWADHDDFETDHVQSGIAGPSDTYVIANELKWRFIN